MALRNKYYKIPCKGNANEILKVISNSITKRGKIKGGSKEETKNLKAMCAHHRINNKGKLQMQLMVSAERRCKCKMCGSEFPTGFITKKEIKEVVGNLEQYVSQLRFMTTAANLGDETRKYLSELSVMLRLFPKIYGRVRVVLQKTNNAKKKTREKQYSNSKWGGWGTAY